MRQTFIIEPLLGKYCISKEQGEYLYGLIKGGVSQGNHTYLDFIGVAVCSLPFLEESIGRLYETNTELVREYLHIYNLNSGNYKVLLKKYSMGHLRLVTKY